MPFELESTTITFDGVLKHSEGRLVVIEAKRWQGSVSQGEIFKFAHSVNKLRRVRGFEVAAFFMVGNDVQPGVLGEAKDSGIEVVMFSPDQPWPNHGFTFLAYDAEYERRSAHYAYIYESVGPIADHVGIQLVSRPIVESIGAVMDHVTVRLEPSSRPQPTSRTATGYVLRCSDCDARLEVNEADEDAAITARHGGWVAARCRDREWLCARCINVDRNVPS